MFDDGSRLTVYPGDERDTAAYNVDPPSATYAARTEAPSIDCRSLLKKYIRMVIDAEGWYDEAEHFRRSLFTEQEKASFLEIVDEARSDRALER